MKRSHWLGFALLGVAGILNAATAPFDAAQIEKLTGLKGTWDAKQEVFKVSYPRSDLDVKSSGVHITPAMGLTAWAAFTGTSPQTMVMGDVVMTEDQVNPVMSVALDNGLQVTALHNHFAGETPRIMFMHISGMGDSAQLASAVGKVFTRLKTPGKKGAIQTTDINPAHSTLDPKKIDAVLGIPGQLSAGVYKVTIGRTTRMHGAEMGNAMGVNTWAAFTGTDSAAVVDGDFAMYEGELQGVLKALRKADIQILSIHNHMVMESPRVIFLHYWGIGDPVRLAQGLKAALDTQK